jgi:DNA-binding MarR family transcriptional regulator
VASEPTVRQVGQRGGNVVLDVYVLNQRVGALLDAVLREQGVTPAEYAVYSQLGIAASTPSELTARLGVKASTLSGTLAVLHGRGHTRKVTDPADRRSYRLELTDSGRATLEACRPLFRRALRRVNRQLAETTGTDVDSIRRLLAGIDAALARAQARGGR